MTHLLLTLRTGFVAFLFIGCGPSAPAGPAPHAALVPTCAPSDEPGVALFLTDQPPVPGEPTPPYIAITVYHRVSQLLGRRFDVGSQSSNTGFAQECPRGGACVSPRAATVAFGGLNADSTIAVSYRLELASGRVLRGAARPRLSPTTLPCR